MSKAEEHRRINYYVNLYISPSGSLDTPKPIPSLRRVPIYEYKCRLHGHIFEARQGFSDPDLTACEVCQAPVDRLVSSPAFHLKGGGWYTTDYKNPPVSAPKSEAISSVPKEAEKKADSQKSTSPESAPAPSEKPAVEKKQGGSETKTQ